LHWHYYYIVIFQKQGLPENNRRIINASYARMRKDLTDTQFKEKQVKAMLIKRIDGYIKRFVCIVAYVFASAIILSLSSSYMSG